MNARFHRWPVLVSGMLIAAGLHAQGDPAQGGEYYIHGIFNPTLSEARKVDVRPEPIDTILPERPVSYELLPVRFDPPARVDSIAPARLNIQSALPKLYHGFVKAGFGLYTTPIGELYYDQTRSRKNGYGIHLKHFSSNGGIDDVGPSDYSFNSAEGFYKAFLDDHEVSGTALYDRRRISYYGYPSNDSIQDVLDATDAPDDFRKQVYNDIGFAARVRTLHLDSGRLGYTAGMEVHQYSNLTESRETNLRLAGDVHLQQGSETYGLGVLLDNNAYRGQLGADLGDFRQNGTLVGLEPRVSTRGEKYEVRIGAGIFLDALGKSTFHFFPQAYLSYSLFNDILVPYAGVDGERRRNSFRSLTRENPWLTGAPALANTSLMYDVYGGLRGSLSSKLEFDVRVSKQRQKGMPLYVRVDNAPFGDQMAVVYDRVDILDVSGSLHYHVLNELDITGRLDLLTYETQDQPEAWNLPPYRIALGATYDIRDKLVLKAEALFLGQRPALAEVVTDSLGAVVETRVQDLDGFLDLYLGAEYRYTKRLSVFLEVSNLSASKYERWFRYPVQRTLVMGGATYRF